MINPPEQLHLIPQFKKGDILLVQPKDEDDSEANARKGQTCRFVRYGIVTEYAVVQFEGSSRFFYFRPKDLQVLPASRGDSAQNVEGL